jgi:hypothetical protein
MAQYGFGSGTLWGTALTDASGNTIANPTPVLFGTLQDVSIDISGDTKQLFGQNQFPVAVGRGKAKIQGKSKFAQINGRILNDLFFGQTVASGLIADVYDTTGSSIPGTTPFTITPTIPSSGTWVQDLGVRDSNGVPMKCVTGTPTTGQYSLTAGPPAVYTFAAADAGKTVFISFQYTASSTVAQKSTVMNVAMGYAPTFRADFFNALSGKALTLTLFSCVASKLALSSKADDFLIPEFDFEAFADQGGRVLQWGTAE